MKDYTVSKWKLEEHEESVFPETRRDIKKPKDQNNRTREWCERKEKLK